jgi:hypothetical protein
MHDDTNRTAQNPSQTVGAGGGRTDQAPGTQSAGAQSVETGSQTTDEMRESPLVGHDEQAGKGIGGHQYDDDGVLAAQTPGLDPEPIRREAGPDWPADKKGDLEVDPSPGGGSGADSSPGGSNS